MTAQAKRKPAPPPAGRRPTVRVCAECHASYWDFDGRKRFCQAKCRQAWHHRDQARGKDLLEAGMALRRKREKGAFSELTRLLDGWIAEDRKKERRNRDALTLARAKAMMGS